MKNAKMSEYRERNDSVYPGLSKHEERDEEYGYVQWRGFVRHRLGVVVVNQYRQWPTEHHHSGHFMHDLRLTIIHEGREHTRSWDAWYGERTISRLANEFITEIKGGDHD